MVQNFASPFKVCGPVRPNTLNMPKAGPAVLFATYISLVVIYSLITLVAIISAVFMLFI